MTELPQPENRLERGIFPSLGLPADRTVRALAIAQTMGAVAAGVYFSSSALFFSRASGLAPLEIGLGLTSAGLVGLLVPLPFGILADRWNPRNIAVWLTVGAGVSYWIFLLVCGITAFVVTACCFAACLRGAMTARMAMIATLIDASRRTQTSAYLRALGNCGLSAGAMIGGLALYFDSLTGYRLAFALGGTIFIAAAALLLCAACLLFAAMAVPLTVWLTALLALLAALLHVLGEMMHMAGAWNLSFHLAPPGLEGEYQGFFNTSSAAVEMFGPILLTALLVGWGLPGWLLLAIVFPAAGLAIMVLFGRQAYPERDLSG